MTLTLTLKVDVESFEFRLLPHLLLTRPRALCAVELLVIEWHEWMNKQHEGISGALSWLMRQPECNMTVESWH